MQTSCVCVFSLGRCVMDCTHPLLVLKGSLYQKSLSLERPASLEQHTDMSLHACHQSKMFDEKFVFDFEHEIAENQLWSHRWSGRGHGLEHIRLNLPFIAL